MFKIKCFYLSRKILEYLSSEIKYMKHWRNYIKCLIYQVIRIHSCVQGLLCVWELKLLNTSLCMLYRENISYGFCIGISNKSLINVNSSGATPWYDLSEQEFWIQCWRTNVMLQNYMTIPFRFSKNTSSNVLNFLEDIWKLWAW